MNKSNWKKWDISKNDEFREELKMRRMHLGNSIKNIPITAGRTLRILSALYDGWVKKDLQKRKIITKNINNCFLTDSYVNFFDNHDYSKITVNVDTPKRFLGNKVETIHDITLDFYAVYLGYAGIIGYLKETSIPLARCFFLEEFGVDDLIILLKKYAKKIVAEKERKVFEEITKDEIIKYLYPKTLHSDASNDFENKKLDNILLEIEEIKKSNQIKAVKENVNDFKSKLRKGSKKYFEELTSTSGRYNHFDIENESRFIETTIFHDKSNNHFSLFNSLQSLWKEDSKHSVLVGEGGMGKTLSLIRLWKYFLKDKSNPIPIYISLNEFSTDEVNEKNYLIKYIAWNYLGIKPLDEITEQKLRKAFVNNSSNQDLQFILFLDGFNEITSDKSSLLDDLNRNWKTKAKSTQIIISSRYDIRYSFNFTEFNLLEIDVIPKETIIKYLQYYKVSFSSLSNFQTLLENPMMLSLYANSAPTIEKYSDNPNFNFKPIESQGELLWNYFESQYVKYFEYYSSNETKTHFYKFLFKHYLPFIGYKMEKRGRYFLTPNEKDEILKQTGDKFFNLKFTNAFREYKKFIRYFNIKTKDDIFEEDERIEYFSDILTKELQVLIVENVHFWFQHQNFRDYFASIHIINEMEVQVLDNKLPEILSERKLPIYLQNFIGQIEGEHHYKPTILENIGWSIDYLDTFHFDNKVAKTKIMKLLDYCRNKFDDNKVTIVIQNLISILINSRNELSGIDLSNLNLLKTNINGIRCFKKYNKNYLSANFNKSLISERNIFFKGHSERISNITYSSHGDKIVIASLDGSIIEWSIETGVVLKEYSGHSDMINSLEYSYNRKFILSTSWDNSIKEWSVETGECILNINEDIKINIAIYSPDCKSILYGLDDGQLKLYDKKSKHKTNIKNDNVEDVMALCFNKSGTKFLSGAGSVIKEWDFKTLKYVNSYEFFKGNINNVLYFPDDEDLVICSSTLHSSFGMISLSQKKEMKRFKIDFFSEEIIQDISIDTKGINIVGSTNKGNVYLWEINSIDEEPKQKFEISKERIVAISFNPNSQSFVCPDEKGFKEWSIDSEIPLRIFNVYRNKSISSLSYAPCGKKFIFGTDEGIVYEWDITLNKLSNIYIGHSNKINDVSYSPDGKTIISCSNDNTMKLWSTFTSECIHTFTEHKDNVNTVAYSKDGSMIASGSKDMTIYIWATKTQEVIQMIKDPDFRIYDIDFAPNGENLISCSLGNILREWLIESGECIKKYSAHKASIHSCSYSPNGKHIVSGSRDFDIKLWDTETTECIDTIHAQNNGVKSVSFNKDGKKILTCGNNYFLYEWTIGQKQDDNDKFKAHDENILQVEYSPDGKRALSCSEDGEVKEWLIEDWSCIETYNIVHGLFLHGCTFNELCKESDISKDNKIVLEKYGAIF